MGYPTDMKTEPEESTMDGSLKTEKLSELTYEEKVMNCNIIAKPMASKKLAKKCYKLVKKGILRQPKYV